MVNPVSVVYTQHRRDPEGNFKFLFDPPKVGAAAAGSCPTSGANITGVRPVSSPVRNWRGRAAPASRTCTRPLALLAIK